ncbi:MAG TPA: hypothetical protein PLN31_19630 [Azoarcus taiwanensis]|nr:hypothetical protein [Azoarcus taiwanensis]
MLNLTIEQIKAALPDALAIRAGLNPPMPHPLAEPLSEAPLSVFAKAAGALIAESNPHRRPADPRAYIAMGYNSSDFQLVLSDALRRLVVIRYQQESEHRGLCKDIPVQNFKPVNLPSIDVNLDLDELNEGAEYRSGAILLERAGETAQLHTLARDVRITRHAIQNDDLGIIEAIFTGFGAAASRAEAQALYGLLEANGDLADEAPVFDAVFGNVTAEAFGETGVGEAIELLRKQESEGGNVINARARHLVVAADLELAAHKLVRDCGLRLDVIATPWLPDGRYYVKADAEMFPVLGRLYLGRDNRDKTSVIVGAVRRQAGGAEFDGIRLGVRADQAVTLMGRVGIVRGGA